MIKRIGWLVQIFRNDMNRWAQIYDLNGEARYAINIIHACSDQGGLNDAAFAYDGHLIFADSPGSFWGDNFGGTDDRWPNWMSELKNPGIKGIVMDTWNGYTEGYAAVPPREHGVAVYNWLADLLEPDPRACSHMHCVLSARLHNTTGCHPRNKRPQFLRYVVGLPAPWAGRR